jgi:hypothetical protein
LPEKYQYCFERIFDRFLSLITLDYFRWVFSGEILSGMESTVNICLEVILILSILGNLVGIIKKTVWGNPQSDLLIPLSASIIKYRLRAVYLF